jgi:Tfp pilus assembly protein PilN
MFALIEMNLLPGGKRAVGGPKKRRTAPKLELGRLSEVLRADPLTLLVLLLAVGGLAYAAVSFTSQQDRMGELETAIERQVEDSIRFSRIIAAADSLRARQDTLGQRIDVIRTIDEDRFIWAHVLDHISQALPDYTWLTTIQQTAGEGREIQIRIEGLTSTTRALTVFMRQLEASPFLRGIRLVSVEQVQQGQKVVNNFVLLSQYEQPDSSVITTEPIILTGE